MEEAMERKTESAVQVTEERPRYEPPTIRIMTEQEILSTFQITQSMAIWWIHNNSPSCTA